MALFRGLAIGTALAAAGPALAQEYSSDVSSELMRANRGDVQHCQQQTTVKQADMKRAEETYGAFADVSIRIESSSNDALTAEEASLRRRINMAALRGDDPKDIRPNAYGDLLRQLEMVKQQRRARAEGRKGPAPSYTERMSRLDEYQLEKHRYEDALLDCLAFRRSHPGREWRDPNPSFNSAMIADLTEPGDDSASPRGGRADAEGALPEAEGVEYRVWMTGTFDTGGGVMTLNPAGGRYQYSNGRMTTTRITGKVM
jgi:hypothetical protein